MYRSTALAARFWQCGVRPSHTTNSRLGGSGSGKTTLLNAVAHRLGDLPLRGGDVSYVSPESGRILGIHEAKRRIGFVRQQDFLVDCLTGEWECRLPI